MSVTHAIAAALMDLSDIALSYNPPRRHSYRRHTNTHTHTERERERETDRQTDRQRAKPCVK